MNYNFLERRLRLKKLKIEIILLEHGSAGLFKILTSFNIAKRGVVIYGQFIEGKAAPGYSSEIDIGGHLAKVKIKDGGPGRPDDAGIMLWGLVLDFENKDLEKIAITDRIKEQTITIYSDNN